MQPQAKIAGDPCSVCNTPYIQGQKGVYCKSCYIKWANDNKPQSNPQAQSGSRDFDAEARGKVRHGLVCAMIAANKDFETISTNLMRFEELIMGKPKSVGEVPVIQIEEEEYDLSAIPF